MTGSFVITVDTAAPNIEFGEIGEINPGELLVIPYTLDEPTGVVLDAILHPHTGADQLFVVDTNELRLDLAEDIAEGAAQVEVLVTDDVGNQATYTFSLTIGQDVVVIPPSRPNHPPTGRRIHEPRRVPRQRIKSRTRVHTSSRSATRVSTTGRRSNQTASGVVIHAISESSSTSGTRSTLIPSVRVPRISFSGAHTHTEVQRRGTPDDELILALV